MSPEPFRKMASAILSMAEAGLVAELAASASRARSARTRRRIMKLIAYNFSRCSEFLNGVADVGPEERAIIEGMVSPAIGDLFRHGNLRGLPIAEECLKLMILIRNGTHG